MELARQGSRSLCSAGLGCELPRYPGLGGRRCRPLPSLHLIGGKVPVSRLGLACPPQAQRSVQDLAEDLQQEILQQIQRAQGKWQHVDNKAAVIVAALGSGFLLWLSLSLLSAIRILPLVPSGLELVGFAVVCWFTYTYLLFKDGREQLAFLVEELKERVVGGIEQQTRG